MKFVIYKEKECLSEQAEDVLMMWVSQLTPNTCAVCEGLHGDIMPLHEWQSQGWIPGTPQGPCLGEQKCKCRLEAVNEYGEMYENKEYRLVIHNAHKFLNESHGVDKEFLDVALNDIRRVYTKGDYLLKTAQNLETKPAAKKVDTNKIHNIMRNVTKVYEGFRNLKDEWYEMEYTWRKKFSKSPRKLIRKYKNWLPSIEKTIDEFASQAGMGYPDDLLDNMVQEDFQIDEKYHTSAADHNSHLAKLAKNGKKKRPKYKKSEKEDLLTKARKEKEKQLKEGRGWNQSIVYRNWKTGEEKKVSASLTAPLYIDDNFVAVSLLNWRGTDIHLSDHDPHSNTVMVSVYKNGELKWESSAHFGDDIKNKRIIDTMRDAKDNFRSGDG